MTAEAEQARHAAAAGSRPDRPPAVLSEKAKKDADFTAALNGEWNKRTGETTPARPEAAPPQQTTDGGLSAEDRAALAQAPPETQAVIDRHLAAHRENYGAVDQLAGRWGGYLSERGAATPAQQVGVLDNLLQTEHRLATGSREEKIRVMQEIAAQYGVGAPTGGQPQAQAQAQPPQAPPQTGDALTDQLQRSHHEQQLDAWRQAMATAGPEGEQAQKVHHAQQHILEVAAAKTADGKQAHPYFAEVGREMHQIISHQMQHGQRPDLVSAYHHAVSLRPDLQQRHTAGLHRDLRAFREKHPIAFDPRIRDRMRIVALGHQRTGTPTNPEAILAEALRREPEAAARNAKQVSQAKQRGHAVMPTLDQSLEAAWQAGVGQ